jgi:hypothetical protein
MSITTMDLFCRKCGGRVKDKCRLECDNCDFCGTSGPLAWSREDGHAERSEVAQSFPDVAGETPTINF